MIRNKMENQTILFIQSCQIIAPPPSPLLQKTRNYLKNKTIQNNNFLLKNFLWIFVSLKPYWDKSRNNLKIDENERVHSNTL